MKKLVTLFLAIFILLTGCASSGISWDTLKKEGSTSGYCRNNYDKQKNISSCEIELAALRNAQYQCKKDSHPSYCVLMAEYNWDNFKAVVLTSAPTIKHAKLFPIMCGHKERKVRPCKEISK